MRYFVRFTYNGTSFHGSQTQPNGITVQEVMEKAFSTLLRGQVALTFAGRTDAGVHALEMYAHFDSSSFPFEGESREGVFLPRLNSLLPPSIAVLDLFPVADDAHARFSARSRTYHYRITTRKDPFNLSLVTRVAPGLDYDGMNRAARHLLGKHDFASFCKVQTDVKTTFCTVSEAHWDMVSDTEAVFVITADRFLRNMVRAVVGTLFEVGRHKMDEDAFCEVIERRNRCSAGQSVPPDGLYLVHIAYPPLTLNESQH